MKRLNLLIQRKGSVGKTTFAAALVEWALRREPAARLALFDPDRENKTLFSIFGEKGESPLKPPHSVKSIDWRGDSGSVVLDDLIRTLISEEEGSADMALLDGVANQSEDVLSWLTDVKLFEQARRFNFGVTVIVAVDETQDSADSAARILGVIKGRADVLVVRSHKVRKVLPWDAALDEAMKKGARIERMNSVSIERFTADVAGYMAGAGTGMPHSLWQASQQDRNTMLKARAESYWERLVPEMERLAPILVPCSLESRALEGSLEKVSGPS